VEKVIKKNEDHKKPNSGYLLPADDEDEMDMNEEAEEEDDDNIHVDEDEDDNIEQ
jgi:hypothetical protein